MRCGPAERCCDLRARWPPPGGEGAAASGAQDKPSVRKAGAHQRLAQVTLTPMVW